MAKGNDHTPHEQQHAANTAPSSAPQPYDAATVNLAKMISAHSGKVTVTISSMRDNGDAPLVLSGTAEDVRKSLETLKVSLLIKNKDTMAHKLVVSVNDDDSSTQQKIILYLDTDSGHYVPMLDNSGSSMPGLENEAHLQAEAAKTRMAYSACRPSCESSLTIPLRIPIGPITGMTTRTTPAALPPPRIPLPIAR